MALQTETAPGAHLDHDRFLDLYRQMLVIRRSEEQLARAHQAGLIPGACHTYVGEEAVAVGVCAHLRPDDTVLSTHRGHGHALAKGVPPVELIAELLGRVTGCSHGRGGSMHIFSPEVGMLGTSGIVGPSILMATGAGYTFELQKRRPGERRLLRRRRRATTAPSTKGSNLASIWKLPVLFVCENNQYATEVPFATVAGNTNVAARGRAHTACPAISVDGNDVLAVYEAAGGGGPARPRRRRADPARVPHLSHAGPLRGHARRRLPHARGGRGLAGARPAPTAARPTARRRRRVRGRASSAIDADRRSTRSSEALRDRAATARGPIRPPPWITSTRRTSSAHA